MKKTKFITPTVLAELSGVVVGMTVGVDVVGFDVVGVDVDGVEVVGVSVVASSHPTWNAPGHLPSF